MTTIDEIPVAHTPPGGYGTVMPPLVLAGAVEPLAAGAPDLRGTWRTVAAADGSGSLPPDHRIWRHVERIEQAADRVVVTGGGVVHDMRVDGTTENGLHDVMVADFSTPLVVVARYESGALVLRPEGLPGVEVARWREGDRLRWRYHTLFDATLERVDG